MAQTGRAHAASIASIHDRTTGSRIAARCCPATRPHLQPRPLPFARSGPKPSASYVVVVVVLFSSCKWMMYYCYDYRIIQPGNGCRQRQGLHPLRQPRVGWVFSAPVITALNWLFLEWCFPSRVSPPLRAEITALHRGTASATALSQGRGARHHRLAHLPQSTPLSAGCPHLRQTRL